MNAIEISPLAAGCVDACRGCAHRRLSPDESAARKEHWLGRKLEPWRERLSPIRASGLSRDYRDRVCLATEWDGARWQFGMMADRHLVPIPACPVHSERVRATVRELSPVLPRGPEFPMVYMVQSGAQVTLVLKSAGRPRTDWLDAALRGRLAAAEVEGLWLHLHPSAGRKIFAKNTWELLWGAPRSRDEQGLWYGPGAFQQLVPHLYEEALDKASRFLQPGPHAAVLDLYSGVGGSLRLWKGTGAKTMGVELSGEAVACARLNIPGVELLRGTCETRLPQLRQWSADLGTQAARLAYVNPPRTGLEGAVAQWLGRDFQPRRLAYLSCSAGTLRRDLEGFADEGYRVERITPYDFFPRTYHVETLALLSRR